MFPAYFFTTLKITVHQQTVAPECPSSGSFRVFFLNDEPSAFSLVCQQKLLTMRYQANPAKPMPQRFRDQRGVDVRIENYGKTESAPFYEPMYEALEEAGYVRDRDIRVAGYDSRLTPDMRNFLNRAKRLIEDTYRDNGNQPVHVVGHSNGPLYIQYLLTHTSQSWKDKYIHGFTPFAGNFPGQGILYPLFFTGLDVPRLHASDDAGERSERRRDDAQEPLELYERLRPAHLRRPGDGRRGLLHRRDLHARGLRRAP
jgi:lecithin-cholesterol acyltransferase